MRLIFKIFIPFIYMNALLKEGNTQDVLCDIKKEGEGGTWNEYCRLKHAECRVDGSTKSAYCECPNGAPLTGVDCQASSTSSSTTPLPDSKCCPAVVARGITWDETCEATQEKDCPEGGEKARWSCNITSGNRTPKSPNLSECISAAFRAMLGTVEKAQMFEALEIMQGSMPLYGGDLKVVTKCMSFISKKLSEDIEQQKEPGDGQGTATRATEQVSTVADNMLESQEIWQDLEEEMRVDTASNVLLDQEKMSFLLASTLEDNNNVTISAKTHSLLVFKLERESFNQHGLLMWVNGTDINDGSYFHLPAGFRKDTNSKPSTSIVFSKYNNLQEVLVIRQENRPIDVSEMSRLNSPVLQVSVDVPHEVVMTPGRYSYVNPQPLPSPAHFLLPHLESTWEAEPICAYWDPARKNWATEGCYYTGYNEDFTECACTHLSSFSLLAPADFQLVILPIFRPSIPKTLLKVGCSLPAVAIGICFIIYLRAFSRILNAAPEENREKCHILVNKNICACLFILEVVYAVGSHATSNQVICSIMAGVLHFFLLCCSFWLLLRTAHLLFYDGRLKGLKPKWYCSVGYGVPLIIFTISTTSRPLGYISYDRCWLSAEHDLGWSFTLPMIVFITADLLGLVFYVHKEESEDAKKQALLKIWLDMTFVLTCTLGFLITDLNDTVAGFFLAFNCLLALNIIIETYIFTTSRPPDIVEVAEAVSQPTENQRNIPDLNESLAI